jgi:hypothetical protein
MYCIENSNLENADANADARSSSKWYLPLNVIGLGRAVGQDVHAWEHAQDHSGNLAATLATPFGTGLVVVGLRVLLFK